ncbi:MAG: ATP-binding protein [Gallionella sp.]
MPNKTRDSAGRNSGTPEGTTEELRQKSLLKTGALQTAILNSANFSSIATDAKGVIQIFNVGAERMLGYAAADVLNKITPADISDPQEVVARAEILSVEMGTLITPGFEALVFKAARGIEDIYELTYIRKDGSRFPAVVSVTALRDAQGAVIGYLLIGTDNTARKQVETERAQLYEVLKEKNIELESAKSVAEKANLAKSVFLSRMSHELRTPLNAILGFAQLLEAGSPPPTVTQILRLQQIIKAGWYLLDLINEILDLAVIESGKLSLSREPVLLTDVMHECQAMIESQAQQHGIHIEFVPFDATWFAYADRTRVKQVIINLLSNAIKYNREHGTVVVACRAVGTERLRVSIKDSGAGLSSEQLAQLFQPFNRLGQESGSEEGTGIGLVVTKQLVELMGGNIGVESCVGVGSEFWIELLRDVSPQLADGHVLPDLRTSSTVQSTERRTLLYVEDNPANLLLVEQIIEVHPQLSMLSARDGKSGIAVARAQLPDVILMDINLPGISGIQAMQILRADPTTQHIPVIALSANAMLSDIENGMAAGFFCYLTKPIKINAFMNALDEALQFSVLSSDRADKEKIL